MNPLMIEQLARLQADLKLIKKKEMETRLKISGILNKNRVPGTYRDDIGAYRVKSVLKYNYTLDKDELEEGWSRLSEDAQSAISWRPSLIKKVYDNLDDDDVGVINEFLTVKPATPSLSVEDLGDEIS